MEYFQLFVAALLVEYLVQQIKTVIRDGKISPWVVVTIAIGIVFALCTSLDMLPMLGFSEVSPVFGMIVTGIIISAGTDVLHALLNKVKDFKAQDLGLTTGDGDVEGGESNE